MAAAGGARLYVLGGYGRTGARRDVFVYDGPRWHRLPPMPFPRAAGGAAFIDNIVYVVGGIGRSGLARSMLAYDVRRKRWRTQPAPRPLREHLGVTALQGRWAAVGGRAKGRPADTRARRPPRRARGRS